VGTGFAMPPPLVEVATTGRASAASRHWMESTLGGQSERLKGAKTGWADPHDQVGLPVHCRPFCPTGSKVNRVIRSWSRAPAMRPAFGRSDPTRRAVRQKSRDCKGPRGPLPAGGLSGAHAPPSPSRNTGMPWRRALSTRLSVTPDPGAATTPIGWASNIWSLRLKGAACLWRFQSGLNTT